MGKILIVDDSRTSRKFLREIVEQAGYTIVGEAENGQVGVAMFNELEPDLVTLDITMPVMDGLEALKQIKKAEHTAKVMMVTAAGQREKLAEAIKNGADEFVTKPYEAEQVVGALKHLLKDN